MIPQKGQKLNIPGSLKKAEDSATIGGDGRFKINRDRDLKGLKIAGVRDPRGFKAPRVRDLRGFKYRKVEILRDSKYRECKILGVKNTERSRSQGV